MYKTGTFCKAQVTIYQLCIVLMAVEACLFSAFRDIGLYDEHACNRRILYVSFKELAWQVSIINWFRVLSSIPAWAVSKIISISFFGVRLLPLLLPSDTSKLSGEYCNNFVLSVLWVNKFMCFLYVTAHGSCHRNDAAWDFGCVYMLPGIIGKEYSYYQCSMSDFYSYISRTGSSRLKAIQRTIAAVCASFRLTATWTPVIMPLFKR